MATRFSPRCAPRPRGTAPARTPGTASSGPPELVLFDLDDTLFDLALTCRAALGEPRREFEFARNRRLDEVVSEYNRMLGTKYLDVVAGRLTSGASRAERFRRVSVWTGRRVGDAEAERLADEYQARTARLGRPVGGAPEAVRRLGNRSQIGIVTNNTVAEQEAKLRLLGLDRTIDHLVTSEMVGVAKPSPENFHTALRQAGVAPNDAVMVGDSWASDLVGARAARIPAVWFNRFPLTRPSGPAAPEFAAFRPRRDLDALLERRSSSR